MINITMIGCSGSINSGWIGSELKKKVLTCNRCTLERHGGLTVKESSC